MESKKNEITCVSYIKAVGSKNKVFQPLLLIETDVASNNSIELLVAVK